MGLRLVSLALPPPPELDGGEGGIRPGGGGPAARWSLRGGMWRISEEEEEEETSIRGEASEKVERVARRKARSDILQSRMLKHKYLDESLSRIV